MDVFLYYTLGVLISLVISITLVETGIIDSDLMIPLTLFLPISWVTLGFTIFTLWFIEIKTKLGE